MAILEIRKEIQHKTSVEYDEFIYKAFDLCGYDRVTVDMLKAEGKIMVHCSEPLRDPARHVDYEIRTYLIDGNSIFDIVIADELTFKYETEYKHVQEYKRTFSVRTGFI